MTLRKRLSRIKKWILKKPFIKDPKYPAFWINRILADRRATIVQIGSNDGKTGDPLHQLLHKHKRWSALFVEPVPYLFERLLSNYPREDRFTFENVAINQGEQLRFYWIDPTAKEEQPDLPVWFEQLGSFEQEHIIKHLGEAIRPHIVSKLLDGVTLDILFRRNDILTVDVLHIDTEGHDWNILSQLSLDSHLPTFILYETNHLSAEDRAASYRFLDNDYVLFEVGIDTLAVSKRVGTKKIIRMKHYMTHLPSAS